MKVNLMSDLHLEWCPMPFMPGGESLLLSGDILVASLTQKKRTDKTSRVRCKWFADFFMECSQKYAHVYYIMGNHEHYHGDFKKTTEYIREFISDLKLNNFNFLNKDVISLTPTTMLFGATMWTDMHKCNPVVMIRAKHGMNDFGGTIVNGKTPGPHSVSLKFTPEDSVVEHETTLVALKKALEDYPDKEFLVMTHHTPSYESIHPKYGNDPLNYAYSSDLSDFILDNPRIKNWVHGHTHDTFDYSVGDCRIRCNPRGYTNNPNIKPENKEFDINFNFEVS